MNFFYRNPYYLSLRIEDEKLLSLNRENDKAIFAENNHIICYMLRKLDEAYHDWELGVNRE